MAREKIGTIQLTDDNGEPVAQDNTGSRRSFLGSGNYILAATASGGVGDGTFSISSTSYTDIDNNTTADLAAQDFSQIPTYSWDDGSTYVSVSLVVDAGDGTVYIVPLDTQNDVRLTGGEVSTTTSGFHGVTTPPVAHSPASSKTRWSFAIRSDGTSIAYGKNRTINFYRRVE